VTARQRWLVVGSAGQLGLALRELADEQGYEFMGVDRDEVDIASEASVRQLIADVPADVVINAAAITHVDGCEEQADTARAVNALGPGWLARECKGRALLVQVSTEFVFAGTGSTPIDEDAETGPLSVYGRTKLDGELAVREGGGEHLIVRTQWLFGRGPNFVRTILTAAGRGDPLRVVEDQIGRPTSARELARGLGLALERGLRGTLHLACDGVASWYDLARVAVDEAAERGLLDRVPVEAIPTREMPRPARRPAHAVLGLEKARREGIRLLHWREALTEYLDRDHLPADG